MQKERTLRFWDDFYTSQAKQSKDPKEWILKPSAVLMEQLAQHIPRRQSLRILEIGCGTSSLARDFWLYLHERDEKTEHTIAAPEIHMWATDVSEVCIRQNRVRDAEILKEYPGFEYGVLNVAEKHPDLLEKFDVILDKGVLDTFMFRSKQRGGGQPYAQLVRNVLDNIQSWLRDGAVDDANRKVDTGGGVYLILTPRPRLKSARDYKGFRDVQRPQLNLADLNRGDLEGEDEEERIFLYVCRKNSSYSPSCSDAFEIDKTMINDSDRCSSCQLTFFEFRKGEGLDGRGEIFWFREWRGHCVHCKD